MIFSFSGVFRAKNLSFPLQLISGVFSKNMFGESNANVATLLKVEKNKLTKLGRCDRTAELQTVELLKLLILLEE